MHNLEALDNGYYEVAGQAMVLSLAQGGPPPAFFAEWVYTYICTQDISKLSLTEKDIPDMEIKDLLAKVILNNFSIKGGGGYTEHFQ